jgi:hypothetical protein
MKNIVLLLLVLIVFKFNIAQPYYPIEFNNSGWNNVGWIIENGWPIAADLYNCYFQSDTLISSKFYHKYYFDRTHYDFENGNFWFIDSSIYIGAMREDDKQYYFLPNDSVNERMIYDFNLGINDTVPVGYYPYSAYIEVITDTNTITLNDGTTRMEYSAHLYDIQGNGVGFCKYVESIGNSYSLVHPDLFAIQNYNGGFERCGYCENGELVFWVGGGFSWPPAEECGFTVAIKDLKYEVNKILSVSPNPIIDDYFIIQLKLPLKIIQDFNINLYNYQGQEIYSDKIILQSDRPKIVNIELRSGIYILQLLSSDTIISTKLVKSK